VLQRPNRLDVTPGPNTGSTKRVSRKMYTSTWFSVGAGLLILMGIVKMTFSWQKRVAKKWGDRGRTFSFAL